MESLLHIRKSGADPSVFAECLLSTLIKNVAKNTSEKPSENWWYNWWINHLLCPHMLSSKIDAESLISCKCQPNYTLISGLVTLAFITEWLYQRKQCVRSFPSKTSNIFLNLYVSCLGCMKDLHVINFVGQGLWTENLGVKLHCFSSSTCIYYDVEMIVS